MDTPSVLDLQNELDLLARKHRVPGAVLGVLDNQRITTGATGVANRDTGISVTPDTLFQIGSITKVWTATLVMQLVDEGLIDLDQPARTYMPHLRFADEKASASITVRHLLTHTSGVDGDFFEDTGRGDDCLKRYVDACKILPQVARPGDMFSYCNAGFIVAGRLIEEVTGLTWDLAVRERLAIPLGLAKTVTLPEEAILHRVAIGHLFDPQNLEGPLVRAPAWFFPRSCNPAGAITSTAEDVLAFVQMHLDAGRARDGAEILSSQSVAMMQQEQIKLEESYSLGRAWGLGWIIYDWGSRAVLGHDGGTIGQNAFLRVVPEDGFAVVLLTNGFSGKGLYEDLFTKIFQKRGFTPPLLPDPIPDLRLEAEVLVGTYDRHNVSTTIRHEDGRFVADITVGGALTGLFPPVRDQPLEPVSPLSFLISVPGLDDKAVMVFYGPDEAGHPRYMHLLGRAARRVG
ncbi:MAG: serine hydrolase domain-containing protein [Actinomycetota bacterium]